MEQVKKEYNLGEVIFTFRVSDGVAVLTTNNPQISRQLYENSVKAGKPNLSYNERLNAVIEKFPGKTTEEILSAIDIDLGTAKDEQQKASRMALERQKKAKDETKC